MEENKVGYGKSLKYYDVAVTFSEFPDETTLCVNITGCPGMCSRCSESWLMPYVGTELTNDEIDSLIESHPGITCFGLMGGDSNHDDVVRVANHVHDRYPELKVGIYSGREYLNAKLLDCLDLYKIGRWIFPEGPVEEWHKKNCGVLQFPWSNQLLFEKTKVGDDVVWENVTYKFRQTPLGNPERYIVTSQDD